MTEGPRRAQAPVPPWRNVRVLSAISQVAVVVAVAVVAWFLLSNLVTAMQARNLFPRLDFLGTNASFDISESLIAYRATDTNGHAMLVGLVNTVLVSFVGIVLATSLGLVVGIARLSRNWLVNRLALAYVEVFRNTPLLLQLFVIYFVVLLQLPLVRDALALPGPIYLSQRGIYLPRPMATASSGDWGLVVGVALVVALAAWFRAGRWEAAGRPTYGFRPLAVAILLGLPLLAWLVLATPPMVFDPPVVGRFNFDGGMRLSPEFAALVLGLSLYTAAFIGEIVRGGIQAVDRGQLEASRAVGLREGQILRLVVLPQALRVIIPPLTSQYLNLLKNSSLAIAVGYSDLFNVSTTIANQTGQPVAVMAIVMTTYLVISLVTSLLMNIYNRRVQFQTR